MSASCAATFRRVRRRQIQPPVSRHTATASVGLAAGTPTVRFWPELPEANGGIWHPQF